MRANPSTLAALAATALCLPAAVAASQKIDLRTGDGVAAVKGEWRYHDVKLVEVATKSADGKPTTTYNIEPKAFGPDFDDSGWGVIDPTTLRNPRGGGQVCFAWYRIKVTIPNEAAGKAVFFQTTVDDYGEVWVDGKLPRRPGDSGGPVVAGFNVPNRVELKGVKPGQIVQIAIFGINGPISAAPGNRIFLGPTFLEIVGD
jgi:gluconolactonase